MFLKKTHVYLCLAFLIIAGSLFTSYTHDNLFMDKLLVSSGIIGCILCVKALGDS
jgi:hypothetical protein